MATHYALQFYKDCVRAERTNSIPPTIIINVCESQTKNLATRQYLLYTNTMKFLTIYLCHSNVYPLRPDINKYIH